MEFSIERNSLLKAIAQAQSVVERRNTIPILANVLIEAEEMQVRFRATDLDVEIVDEANATVRRAGATTVIATTFHEIVRKLPEGALVTISDDGSSGRMAVNAGRSNFSLATLPREDFPAMAASDYDTNFSVPAPALRRLFDKSKFAMSTEEARYYLNGVYMHVADSGGSQVLRCVATDGHQLAQIDAELPSGADGMPGVIVPRKTVNELRMILEADDQEIAVSVSESKVRFAAPGITLTSKVVEGTFPDYTRVIPTENDKRLEVDAKEFAKAVDRVATVSSETSRVVKLSLSEDQLQLSVNSPETGTADEELEVAYQPGKDAPALVLGFNAKYLQEIAGQMDRENAVLLFNTSSEPALIREGDDDTAIYVVMPMRV